MKNVPFSGDGSDAYGIRLLDDSSPFSPPPSRNNVARRGLSNAAASAATACCAIKREEPDDLRDKTGRVAVKCEFCSTEYPDDDARSRPDQRRGNAGSHHRLRGKVSQSFPPDREASDADGNVLLGDSSRFPATPLDSRSPRMSRSLCCSRVFTPSSISWFTASTRWVPIVAAKPQAIAL